MYDPTNAKFISEDPLGFEAEGTNLSAYVLNNPVNYTDPYGEDLYSVLNTVDRGAAGFADVITKPLSPLGLDSTTIRAKLYGELATRNHDGTAFHVGQGVGAVTLLVAGFNTPQALGNLGWAGKGLVALEVGHTGYGAYESTRNIIEGCATPLDALSFLPLLGAVGKGAKNASKLDQLDDLDDAARGLNNAGDDISQMMFQSDNLTRGDTLASEKLLDSMKQQGREVLVATPGSDEEGLLNYFKANASVNISERTGKLENIIVRPDVRKIEIMEEFLHGTQEKLGIIEKLGDHAAEIHVKNFMIRHKKMLGLSDNDIEALVKLRDSYIRGS